ncbi:Death-associated protein kinase 1 [Rhodotorula kratochvilovae]
MAEQADYNQDHPSTILVAGTLQGKAVGVNTTSIRSCDGKPILVASLSGGSAFTLLRGGVAGLVAIKAIEDDRTRVPCNPRREAQLLAKLGHPNVLSLLNACASEPTPSSPSPRIALFTPFYPHTLQDLLASPSFTLDASPEAFHLLSRSIALQLLAAVMHLHERGIAHRDINPNNIVLSAGGRVVLIDFGIAVEAGDEPAGEMHFEVGTGSFRAPELIFASRSYDPPALDLWATGATLASLFRPLAFPREPSPDTEDSFERAYRQYATPPPPPVLQRTPLFDGGASDFVLAASVFRVLGTPTVGTWPEAVALPSFSRFTFAPFAPTPLASHLPHLPPSSPALLSALEGLLRISAAARMSAAEALAMLEAEGGVALPDDFDERERTAYGAAAVEDTGRTELREALATVLAE